MTFKNSTSKKDSAGNRQRFLIIRGNVRKRVFSSQNQLVIQNQQRGIQNQVANKHHRKTGQQHSPCRQLCPIQKQRKNQGMDHLHKNKREEIRSTGNSIHPSVSEIAAASNATTGPNTIAPSAFTKKPVVMFKLRSHRDLDRFQSDPQYNHHRGERQNQRLFQLQTGRPPIFSAEGICIQCFQYSYLPCRHVTRSHIPEGGDAPGGI